MSEGSGIPDFEPPEARQPQPPPAPPALQDQFARQSRRPAPVHAPGRSAPLIIALSLAVVLALLAADRVGPRLLADRVADQIQSMLGTEQRPVVRLGGFPFLTQVVSRRYQRIEITARDIPVRSTDDHLRIDRFDATLVGVRPDASYRTVTIGRLTGTATIGYAGLTDYVGTTISYDTSGANGSGYVAIAIGEGFTITGKPTIDARSNQLYLLRAEFRFGGRTVAGANPGNLPELFWFELPQLIDGARLSSVRAGPTGLELTAVGRDLTLRR